MKPVMLLQPLNHLQEGLLLMFLPLVSLLLLFFQQQYFRLQLLFMYLKLSDLKPGNLLRMRHWLMELTRFSRRILHSFLFCSEDL